MDIQSKHCYGRLTWANGDIELFESGGIQLTLRDVMVEMKKANRKMQTIIIELSPTPFPAQKLDDSVRFASTWGIDPSMIVKEEDLPESLKDMAALAAEVADDPTLAEYRSMMITSIREATMPERQVQLKRYVEQKYTGTPHWDGVHRW